MGKSRVCTCIMSYTYNEYMYNEYNEQISSMYMYNELKSYAVYAQVIDHATMYRSQNNQTYIIKPERQPLCC